MKRCLSCTRKIPLLAGRCPHCLEQDQGVHGRLTFLVILIVLLVVGGNYYLESKKNDDPRSELVRLLNE